MPGSTTPSVSEIATDGIDRIAAGAQRVEPGLGGERMVGAHRAVAAHDQNAVVAGREVHGLAPCVHYRCGVEELRHGASRSGDDRLAG